MIILGVLVPPRQGPTAPPASRPLGRAALRLANEGINLVFGWQIQDGVMQGVVAEPGIWLPTTVPVLGVYDRFPSQGRPEVYQAAIAGLARAPICNHPSVVSLCRDKIESQIVLEAGGIRMPALGGPADLERWGGGFVKPQFGAHGAGVQYLQPGASVPQMVAGLIPDQKEPAILQQAIAPPQPWAGVSVRQLMQRTPTGWFACEPVFRCSLESPVVNVARGAEVHSDLPVDRSQIAALSTMAAQAIEAAVGPRKALELGFDLVLDKHWTPWVIEVNGRPRGRLEVLARQDPDRFGPLHDQAVDRPLRTLAQWAE